MPKVKGTGVKKLMQKFENIEEIAILENIFKISDNIQNPNYKSKVNDPKKQREVFNKIDIDGSGTIDFEEFLKVMKQLGVRLNRKQLKEKFMKVDTDGSGTITFQEF